jgi:L-fuculose-phosphate aldolase
VTTVSSARRQVHGACLRMVADGLVVASSGNISVRTGSDAFVVTAGGVPYHLLKPTDHPVVSTIDGTHTGLRKPTSELSLHLAIYRAMPDVNAVVHTHSRYAAAFSVARVDLPFICNENITTHAEKVLVTGYEAPGTRDLGEESLRTFRRQPGSRAILLANHGVVAVAGDLETAYNVAAQVEWVAGVAHLAATIPPDLGPVTVLPSEVQDLIGRNYGVTIARESGTQKPDKPEPTKRTSDNRGSGNHRSGNRGAGARAE